MRRNVRRVCDSLRDECTACFGSPVWNASGNSIPDYDPNLRPGGEGG